MESRLPTKPGSYREVISRSLMLYRLSFFKVAIFSILLSFVVFIPRIISDVTGHDLYENIPLMHPKRLWIFVLDISSLTFFIAILWHMYCVLLRIKEPMIQDLKTGLKKVLSVYIAAILQCAIVFGVSFLIFCALYFLFRTNVLFHNSLIGNILTALVFFGQMILIFYVSTLFVFIIPLISIENKGIINSMEKSSSLVWNHWWRVFSVQMTPWFTYVAFLFLLKYFLKIDVHIFFTPKLNHGITTTLLNVALFTLFIPWVAALLLSQLKDLELRKSLAKAIS